MNYIAPIDEMVFLIENIVDFEFLRKFEKYRHFDIDTTKSILIEAAKVSEQKCAPLNSISDKYPARLEGGQVYCSPGFKEAYISISKGGWVGMNGNSIWGGMDLPLTVTNCVNEMMGSACLSLSLNPLMTQGQIEALESHASEELKSFYLPKLISGEWSGTMNLTEPSAGSDVGALTSKAIPNDDGTYMLSGQKIYISWGDHDLTENICHLVLARLPNAAKGSKGISLFLVPKLLQDEKNEPTVDNKIRILSIENKMGLHGSPTAVIEYNKAKGWLVGAPHSGMSAMFTMMNNARLGVAVQGLSQSEAAMQKAINFAKVRKQGKSQVKDGCGTIIDHADVRRNLLYMKTLTFVSRAICLDTALAIDISKVSNSADFINKGAFLTPIAKSFSTDVGSEVASIGMQVHGGMGYIKETGAEQIYRDVRITSIYEGTNGIQAMDLVSRKLSDNGQAAKKLLKEIENTETLCKLQENNYFRSKLKAARLDLLKTLDWMISSNTLNNKYGGASPFLKTFGFVLGAHYLIKAALKSEDKNRHAMANFYVDNVLPMSFATSKAAISGIKDLYSIDF